MPGDEDAFVLRDCIDFLPDVGRGFVHGLLVFFGVFLVLVLVGGVGGGEFVGDGLHHVFPVFGGVPHVRVVQFFPVFAQVGPVEQIFLGDRLGDRYLPVTLRPKLVNHVGFHVEAGPENQVGAGDFFGVLGGGLVGVRVTAGPHHDGHVCVGGNIFHCVANVTSRGKNGELFILPLLIDGASGHTRHQGNSQNHGKNGALIDSDVHTK